MKINDVMKLRIRLGLSQLEFADLLGVHQTTVSKWELGGNISGPARKILARLQQEDSGKLARQSQPQP